MCVNLGHWRTLERSIPRKEVTTVQFVDDGAALLCGASDGTVYVIYRAQSGASLT